MVILPWARAVLQTTPDRWLRLTAGLPADLLRRPPAEGEWSALECLQHLVDTEETVFAARVRFLLAEQDFPAFDPDREGTKPEAALAPADLAGEFSRQRTRSLALIDTLAEADLKKRARHAELGPVTLEELLHEWAGHDLMHTVQAEQALMQPFIDGCGPWQSYFETHRAKSK